MAKEGTAGGGTLTFSSAKQCCQTAEHHFSIFNFVFFGLLIIPKRTHMNPIFGIHEVE